MKPDAMDGVKPYVYEFVEGTDPSDVLKNVPALLERALEDLKIALASNLEIGHIGNGARIGAAMALVARLTSLKSGNRNRLYLIPRTELIMESDNFCTVKLDIVEPSDLKTLSDVPEYGGSNLDTFSGTSPSPSSNNSLHLTLIGNSITMHLQYSDFTGEAFVQTRAEPNGNGDYITTTYFADYGD